MTEIIRGDVDSHIQLPKSTLMKFCSKYGFKNENGLPESMMGIYCLKRNGAIEFQDVEKANVEYGYYENIIEQELSIIESNFAVAKTNILKHAKRVISFKGEVLKDKIIISKQDKQAIFKYCSVCWMRSPTFVQNVAKCSFVIQSGWMVANAPQNIVLMQYFNDPEMVDKYFSKMNITFVANGSNINFVLPQIGFIAPLTFDEKTFEAYIPIHPKAAIHLTQKPVVIDNALQVYRIEATDVDYLNKLAIHNEIRNNVGNVYAKRKEDLLRYKEFYSR